MTTTFPLIPRRRVLGLPFGGLHSMRRGLGSDVAGSRPYQPGDDVDRIDWYASARLSLARGSEEFVVREHYADEAPRVVVLCDRRPSMSLFPEGWPWLSKPEAIRSISMDQYPEIKPTFRTLGNEIAVVYDEMTSAR